LARVGTAAKLQRRQNASGGKDRLGAISKRGDRYLRHLLVVGATAVVRYTRRKTTTISIWDHQHLGPSASGTISIWANRLLDRKPARLVTVAVANKMARIAWAVMAREENYRATPTTA
jgi:transposase